jgi:PIN domain nuclease of toxin-antitoxin system
VHLDTHVVIWLFAGEVARFPEPARERLETQPLAVSPMVELELQYLYETERVTEPASVVMQDLERRIGLEVVDASFQDIVERAMTLSWTRDPFDRLIAAHSALDGVPLLTADETILASLPEAVWSL